MPTNELDVLLDRIPQIADAVNQFSSESMQAEVFRALMKAFYGLRENAGGVVGNTADDEARRGPAATDPAVAPNSAAKKTAAKKPASSKTKQSFSVDKDLDLVNGGSPPFKEFWQSKSPTTQQEKGLICVYWLSRKKHEKKPVSIDQVYTCFKDAGWAVPGDLANTLAQAGTRGWLDSKKRDDLKVVVQGENHIDHDMPAKLKGV